MVILLHQFRRQRLHLQAQFKPKPKSRKNSTEEVEEDKEEEKGDGKSINKPIEEMSEKEFEKNFETKGKPTYDQKRVLLGQIPIPPPGKPVATFVNLDKIPPFAEPPPGWFTRTSNLVERRKESKRYTVTGWLNSEKALRIQRVKQL